MEFNLTEVVLGGLALLLSSIFGLVARSRGDKLKVAKELLSEISKAMDDNKITNEEMQKIFNVIQKF